MYRCKLELRYHEIYVVWFRESYQCSVFNKTHDSLLIWVFVLTSLVLFDGIYSLWINIEGMEYGKARMLWHVGVEICELRRVWFIWENEERV
jgi:hypothetical protein